MNRKESTQSPTANGPGQFPAPPSGDESEPKEFERRIRLEDLVAPEFFFRERELLYVDDDMA